jgi:hypothetical protein
VDACHRIVRVFYVRGAWKNRTSAFAKHIPRTSSDRYSASSADKALREERAGVEHLFAKR